MAVLMFLRTWFGRLRSTRRAGPYPKKVLPRHPYRPVLEVLEDRLPPGSIALSALSVGSLLGTPLQSPLPPSTSSQPQTPSLTTATPSTSSTAHPAATALPVSAPPQPATPAQPAQPPPASTNSTTGANSTNSLAQNGNLGVFQPASSNTSGGGGASSPSASSASPAATPSASSSTGGATSSGSLSISIGGVGPDTGASSTDRLTNATSLSVFGTATANATVGVFVNNLSAMTQADAKGNWSATLPGTLPEGTFTIMAGAMGSNGQTPATAQSSVTIDRTPPTVILQAPTSTINPTPTVTVTAADANGVQSGVAIDVDLKHDGSFTDAGDRGFATGTLNASGVTSIALPTLAPGTYQIEARVSDLAGNEGTSAPVSMQLSGNPFANIALNFTPNEGQAAPQFQYVTQGFNYSLGLSGQGATLSMIAPGPAVPGSTAPTAPPSSTAPTASPGTTATTPSIIQNVQVGLVGANPMAQAIGVDQLPGVSNYLSVNGPNGQPLTNLPNYSEVHYQNVYQGIDVVYNGNQGNLQSDFIVRPGADPSQIGLNFQGVQGVSLDASGNLVLQLSGGTIAESAPVVYQLTASGQQQAVSGQYVLLGSNQVGFKLGAYNTKAPLIIDPTLTYSTFVGGGGDENGNAIAVDASGDAYVVGSTTSSSITNFAPSGSLQTSNGGGTDAVVFKLNAAGTALIYSTFLGGGGDEHANGIAIDGSGNAYVTGDSTSSSITNFAPAGSFQTTNAGGDDAIVFKLDAAGTGLIYSTFLGGSKDDVGNGIAVDSSGDAYVIGSTNSTNSSFANFAPAGSFQTNNAGGQDAFVCKFVAAGTSLTWSTYLGGSQDENGRGIAVDSSGDAYVIGDTKSDNTSFSNFAPAGSFQTNNAGGQDAFVAKFAAAGTSLTWSTYLGGSATDGGANIAVDGAGSAYVVGGTASASISNFAPAGSFQTANAGGGNDVYLAKFTPAGTSLVYSTFFGGSADDHGPSIALDSQGRAYLTGQTKSTDFPLKNPIQATENGKIDAFVAVFDPTGTQLLFSTYLGGSSDDIGGGIALDPSNGNVFVTGTTSSTDFPITPGAFQTTEGGGQDIFVTQINASTVIPPPPPPPGGGGPVGGVAPPSVLAAVIAAEAAESNQTSDTAAQLGTLGPDVGLESFTNLDITRLTTGQNDYDWYRWTADTAGTFTAKLDVTSGGTLELHVFTLAGNTLSELANSSAAAGGSTSLGFAAAPGQALLVEVKGANTSPGVQDQGTYNLSVNLQ